ncbi:MAG: hypothetical protein M3371_08815 [Acidobacteriota bacterium]|nr:hypothetical protein [Acidobacteriota bacterium]
MCAGNAKMEHTINFQTPTRRGGSVVSPLQRGSGDSDAAYVIFSVVE